MPDFHDRFLALVAGKERVPILAAAPAVKGDETTAVLRLYDSIDSWGEDWGVSAKEFADVLDELPDSITEIRLLVNSPGGEAFEGVAILNQLRSHAARVVAVVEGIAGSAASFIAAGVDELVMAPNSELFIHRAWGLCVGNAEDMTQLADQLEHVDRNLASIYAAKANGTVDEWLAAMSAETWYSAEEAVAAGLADSVDGAMADATPAKNRFDLSIFKNSGRGDAPGLHHPAADPAGGPRNQPGRSPAVAYSDEQLSTLRKRLNLADEADEAAIQAAAVEAALVEPEPAPADPPNDTPPELPEGVVAISAEQLQSLQADAQAGREARAEQIRNERLALIRAAVADGRIAPAERDAWLAKLETDTGADKVLAGLAKGTVPLEPIGAAGAADLDSDEAIWAGIYGKEVQS